jgi:hypothetical protein
MNTEPPKIVDIAALTLKESLALTHFMWSWIAANEGSSKESFLHEYSEYDVNMDSNCALCEFTKQQTIPHESCDCSICPMRYFWREQAGAELHEEALENHCCLSRSPYWIHRYTADLQLKSQMAQLIADGAKLELDKLSTL